MEALVAGAAKLGLHSVGPDASGLITTTAADCPLPVTLGLFALDGGEDASVARLGFVEERVDRLHVWGSWLRANIEALLGLRQVRVPRKLVLAVLPEDCPHLAELDWAVLSPRN
jgi:hypothetical protein